MKPDQKVDVIFDATGGKHLAIEFAGDATDVRVEAIGECGIDLRVRFFVEKIMWTLILVKVEDMRGV